MTYDDVAAAAARIEGVAHRTPVITSHTLDKWTGASVFVKAENFQRMGAFKFRGAYNRISQLSPEDRERGVVAFSSGNHAQGVALAAQICGVPATIVMPHDAPKAKVAATRGYGAAIVQYDRFREDRTAIARKLAEERGATLVPPYDDPHIIAGQGTAALELFATAGPLDVLLVPTGGGGLLAGSTLAAIENSPLVEVYGVEPDTGNDWQQSIARGERVTIDVPKTIADGIQTTAPGVLPFAIFQRYGKGIVTVSDDELRTAMRFAFERLKIVIEPSGAAGLAALMHAKVQARGRRVGIIISGGNVDPIVFAEAIAADGAS
ncbi:MAG TPA: threo-3-hydroxy-L-aspartate ammonia-lyase [Candidatus Acidoferrales bacterium]|nr:threo-3-hydroxy-L-aspartate ammonia-lyase [Candidatus Acidoferrales bacterium]